jgi:thiamine biosynthesis lipoprotein
MSLPVRQFSHQAMATTWELFLAGDEADAAEAAHIAFREIDHLESDLTRFRLDSDIGRLNQLPAGGITRVGAAAMDCVLLARDVHEATGGAFDITIGPLFQCWVGPEYIPRRPDRAELAAARARCGMENLIIDPENLTLGVKVEGMIVDLGAVGKGYAVDQAALRLHTDLGLGNFMINAGDSTLLATGPGPDGEGWPIHAGRSGRLLHLRDESISGSGVSVKGAHVIDPRSGKPVKIGGRDHVWVRTTMASVADAFSTAFLVLKLKEAKEVCARHPEITLVAG